MSNLLDNIKTIFTGKIATEDYVQKEIAKLGFKIEKIEIICEINDKSLGDIYEIIESIKDELKELEDEKSKLKKLHEELIKKEKEQKRAYQKSQSKASKQKPQGPVIDENDYTEEIKQLINKNKTRNKVSEPQKIYIKNIVKQYQTASYQKSYEDAIYANVFLDIWAPVINKIRKPEQAFEMQIALNNIYNKKMNLGEC